MATRLPSGNYRTLVQIGDRKERRYKSFTGKTAREADMKAEQWKLANKQDYKRGSFKASADAFICSQKGILSPNTIRGYAGILSALDTSAPELMRTELSEITRQSLQEVLHLPKKPKTIRNYLGFISSVLAYNDIRMPRVKAPECPTIALYIPDEKMVRAVIKAASGTRLEIPVALAARGMRPAEICAVRSTDLNGDTLHIASAYAYTGSAYVRKAPKTKKSDRIIPVPKHIAEKICEEGKATSMTPGALTAAWRRFREKNGFPYFRLYDLRHAFVSIAHANGIPDSYIMSLGGWSTPYTMQRVYRHSLDSSLKKYSAQIENILS